MNGGDGPNTLDAQNLKTLVAGCWLLVAWHDENELLDLMLHTLRRGWLPATQLPSALHTSGISQHLLPPISCQILQ
jgi:hypothetical protein